MRFARNFSAVLAAAAICASPAAASPWNRDPHRAFIASTAGYYSSAANGASYRRTDSDAYFEIGLSNKWMAAGKLVYSTAFFNSPDFSETRSGIGEADIRLQRQLTRGLHSASAVQISGIWSSDIAEGSQSGRQLSKYGAELRALYGRDVLLKPVKIFATAETAYQRRFGGDADQVRLDALVGGERGCWLLLLETQSIISLRNNAPAFQDFDLVKAQASIVWRTSRRWSLVAGVRKDISARNLQPGAGFFVGAWSHF